MNNKEIIESLNQKIAEYRKIIESMTATISALESGFNINKDNNYNPSWSLSEKIAFLFKRESRFLHNRELADLAHEIEPNISVNDFVSKFSPVLSRLKREGNLISIQIGKSLRNTFWGSDKWLDLDSKPKEGYEINEDYVIDKDKKKVELFE